MTQTMQQDYLMTGCWDRAGGSTRAVCSPQVAVTHTAPQLCPPGARCAPTATSGQRLPDTSWHWMDKSGHSVITHKQKILSRWWSWMDPAVQLSMEEHVAGLDWYLSPALPQPETAVCFTPPSSLHMQQDIQLLLLNQMGKRGRVRVAQKRKVQLKHSEKIAIKSS